MLKQRVITAIGLLLMALVFLFVFPPSWLPYWVLSILALMAWEWAGLAKVTSMSHRLLYVFVAVVTAAIPLDNLTTLLQSQWWQWITLLLTVFVLVSVRRFALQGYWSGPWSGMSLIFGMFWLINFAWSFVAIHQQLGVWWLLYAMSLVWLTDTGAYFSGKAFGRRKLAIKVSPGKTWEGVYGGVALAVVMAVSIALWTERSVGAMVLIAFIVSFLSVYGDLFESALKRQAGCKDSSAMLPGHGGWLDRFDALLLALPLFWLLWQGLLR